MADDVDQGYTWETEYERTWYALLFYYLCHFITLLNRYYGMILVTLLRKL